MKKLKLTLVKTDGSTVEMNVSLEVFNEVSIIEYEGDFYTFARLVPGYNGAVFQQVNPPHKLEVSQWTPN